MTHVARLNSSGGGDSSPGLRYAQGEAISESPSPARTMKGGFLLPLALSGTGGSESAAPCRLRPAGDLRALYYGHSGRDVFGASSRASGYLSPGLESPPPFGAWRSRFGRLPDGAALGVATGSRPHAWLSSYLSQARKAEHSPQPRQTAWRLPGCRVELKRCGGDYPFPPHSKHWRPNRRVWINARRRARVHY